MTALLCYKVVTKISKNKEKKSFAVRNKSCWDCSYQQLAGVPFFGKCLWFSKNKKGEDKEILSELLTSVGHL